MQWQPDGLTIRTKKWLLGAGFLEHLPSLSGGRDEPRGRWRGAPAGLVRVLRAEVRGPEIAAIAFYKNESLTYIVHATHELHEHTFEHVEAKSSIHGELYNICNYEVLKKYLLDPADQHGVPSKPQIALVAQPLTGAM